MERATGVGPFKGLSDRSVEVMNEVLKTRFQFLQRSKAGSLEEASTQNAEPNLDWVQPGTVFGRVDPPNAGGLVF